MPTIKTMFPFALDAVVKPYGANEVVARLHALQRTIPIEAYANLAATANGTTSKLEALEPYFERSGCVSLVGKGENGVAFRICKGARGCNECMLLKVVDTSRDPSGHPDDLFIEAEVHDALTVAFMNERTVAGYSVQPCIHFPQLINHVIEGPYMFLFMQLVDRGKTLLAALDGGMGASQLKAIMFQVLYTLACFQREFPSFRHNDLHMGNVMVVQESRPRVYVVQASTTQKFQMPKSSGAVSIIDFGLSSSAKFRNMVAVDMEHKGYGVQRCDLYDLHALVEEMRTLKDLPSVKPFLAACERWIPARFFRSGPLFLARHHRLSTRGQEELQALGGSPLRFIMEDAYFESLRLPPNSTAVPSYGCSFD